MKKWTVYIIILCLSIGAFAEKAWSAQKTDYFVILSEVSPSELESKVVEMFNATEYQHKTKSRKYYEMFFDFDDSSLLNSKRYIKYIAQEVLTPKKRVKYNEEVQFLDKKGKLFHFPVKHYDSAERYEGKHPLISMIQRKYRESVFKFLESKGLPYPLRLKAKFGISKNDTAFGVYADKRFIGFMNLSHINSEEHSKLSFCLVKIVTSDRDTRLHKIGDELKKMYSTQNFTISDTLQGNDYLIITKQMDKVDRFFKFKIEHPYAVKVIYSLITALIGFLIIKLLFWKRMF